MKTSRPYRFETLAVHAGHEVDLSTGAVSPPIHMSTTFERDVDGSYPRGFMYGRNHNPNRNGLEAAIAALEGGAASATFGSGLAAVTAIMQGLQPGDHVVAPSDIYHGTANVLKHLFSKWGVDASFVDMTHLDVVAKAIRGNTRIVWIETPSNPLLQCVDIAALADLAHRAGARAIADNTFATPALQNPLALGCDMVMHSTTKYLGGRSDVMGGVVVSLKDDEAFATVRQTQLFGGGIPSPFDCWLVMRSLSTLSYRMQAHCANARKVATWLHEHPKVSVVHYPGLEDNPFHAIAARQMNDFGGMLSFEVKGGKDAAMAVAASVDVFTRATSLGGVESLIEHRASIEGPESKTPQGLLRMSIGLEHPDDLIEDLRQALDRVN
ncbi:trans-sulfuration enzyme family protein [Trinickia dinghuensis]|uniref:Aminotransferase class V-fold PLP-dependent enzyme n=1 Tax=Trinickia dinghuensis TaxID=2291023 RepID=A0A3D8K6G5_9BURK|nr:aminotransferase class V-fold PLP-dependent enzyme [Trinickia dinghuensis]RDV00477.1 aminotransferase class V-fold PLP-dependent enzyme [Trinickia dinghuensis]